MDNGIAEAVLEHLMRNYTLLDFIQGQPTQMGDGMEGSWCSGSNGLDISRRTVVLGPNHKPYMPTEDSQQLQDGGMVATAAECPVLVNHGARPGQEPGRLPTQPPILGKSRGAFARTME